MKLSLLSFVQLALLAVGVLQVGANSISELDDDIVDRKDHRVSGQRVIYDNATLEYLMEGQETASAMDSMLRGDDEDMESSLVSKRNFLYERFGRPRPRNSPRSSNLVIERKIKHPATNTTVIVMRRSAEITRMDQESVSKTLSNDISLTSQLDSEETLIFGPKSVNSNRSTSPMDYVPLLVGGLVLPIWLLWKTKKAKEVSDAAAAAENDGHEDIPLYEVEVYDDKKDSEPLLSRARRSPRIQRMNAAELLFVCAPVLVWLERAVYVLIICTSLVYFMLLFLRDHQNDRSTLAVRATFTFCFFATLFLFASYTLLYLHAAELDASHVAKPIPRDSVSEDSPRKAVNKPRLRSNSNPPQPSHPDMEAAKSPVFRSFCLDGTSKLRLVIVGFLPGLLAGLFSYFFIINGFMEDKETSLAWLFPATVLPQVSGTSTTRYLAYALFFYILFVIAMLLFISYRVTDEAFAKQHQLALQVNGPQIQLSVIRQYAFLASLTLYHLMLFVVLVLVFQPENNATPRKLALFNVLLKHAFAGISLCLILCQYMLQCIQPGNIVQQIQRVEGQLQQSITEMQKITARLKTRDLFDEDGLDSCRSTLGNAMFDLVRAKQMTKDLPIAKDAWRDALQRLQQAQDTTVDEAAELLMRLVIAHLRGCVECVPSIPRAQWQNHYDELLVNYAALAARGYVNVHEIIKCAKKKMLVWLDEQPGLNDE